MSVLEDQLTGDIPVHSSGIVIWQRKLHWISIESPRLIMDCLSLAAAEAVKFEDLSEVCTNKRESRKSLQIAKQIRRWIANPHGVITHDLPGLKMRQIWKPLRVTRETLPLYMDMVLAVAVQPTEWEQPSFVMALDLPVPEIRTTQTNRNIAWHCGPDFLGYTSDSQDLRTVMQNLVSLANMKHVWGGYTSSDWTLPPME